jgi:hypothetical protein
METVMDLLENASNIRIPWYKGKLAGQKPPLKLHEVWSIDISREQVQSFDVRFQSRAIPPLTCPY